MKLAQKLGLKNKTGALGEGIALSYLKRRSHSILATNYLKKWGEIDIISREIQSKQEIIHFVEVKTVSYETKHQLEKAVSYGTWRPEENVHPKKLQRLTRTIETWILENDYEGEWQIDVIAVRIVPHEKFGTIKYIENVIME